MFLKDGFKPEGVQEKAEKNSEGIEHLICERSIDRQARLVQPGLRGRIVPSTNMLRKKLSTKGLVTV